MDYHYYKTIEKFVPAVAPGFRAFVFFDTGNPSDNDCFDQELPIVCWALVKKEFVDDNGRPTGDGAPDFDVEPVVWDEDNHAGVAISILQDWNNGFVYRVLPPGKDVTQEMRVEMAKRLPAYKKRQQQKHFDELRSKIKPYIEAKPELKDALNAASSGKPIEVCIRVAEEFLENQVSATATA